MQTQTDRYKERQKETLEVIGLSMTIRVSVKFETDQIRSEKTENQTNNY